MVKLCEVQLKKKNNTYEIYEVKFYLLVLVKKS